MPDPERPTGRSRLWDALRRPSRSQVVVAILLAIVGFAAVVQIQATEDSSSYAGLREQDLIDVLAGLSGTTQRTQAEIDRLTSARSELRSEAGQRSTAVDQAQQEVDSLNVLAGVVPVTGPGIRVTITEQTGRVTVSSMLDVIQELRSNSAEAIQVNGQVRAVAQTSFEDGVGGLVIDGTLVESPYVIDVIGVANTLASAMRLPVGPLKQLRDDGAVVEVTELASLDIDAVRRLVQPEFATPDP
ncbi:MAG: DUF881 domain-containing protein [Actinobacteria bacterium]|jgi:uncharacterized protein YlxW (UPF0749 family)|nr:DUF881 domain-containing protein [Actinomycetota bacterium]